jgi:prophage maintenance system killer protein
LESLEQIFIDGNKRTSIIFINHYLISNGKGIIVISAELTEELFFSTTGNVV